MKEKQQLLVILTIVFLGFVGISMPYLIFPALILNPLYSIVSPDMSDSIRALLLGLLLAAYPLGQFIGSPILGALSDDYGRKNLLTGSLFVTAICNLVTGFAIGIQHLALLIFSRFLAGLMEGNIAIARAMAADIKSISKHKTFGKVNASISIAYLIGPLIGGMLTDKNLFEKFTLSTPFYLICILFFALTVLSALILKKSSYIPTAKKATFFQRINLFKRLSTLFTNKQLKFLLISSTIFTLAVDIFYEFGPVYLTVKWTLGPSDLIIYNAVLCLSLAIGNGILPSFFSSRFPTRPIILSGIGAFTLFLIGLIFTNSSLAMLLLFTIMGFAIGLTATLITVRISDSVSDQIQGEVMGTQLSLRVLGDGIICLFGGALLIVSPKLILMVAAVLSILSMIYYRSKDRINPSGGTVS